MSCSMFDEVIGKGSVQVPSALTFYNRTPGGFDTFEKIHLSPDGDDDDDPAGLGNSPLLTSLPGQLLKTSERQLSHSMPGVESDKHKEIPGGEEEEEEGAEEVKRLEGHIKNMVNEYLSSDSTCRDLPNFICEADIIALAWPEQQPRCESACDSSEHIQDELKTQSVTSTVATESDSLSDVSGCPQFEMKKQFDMVLKELNLFFSISINEFSSDSRASTPEQGRDAAEMLVGGTSCCKEPLSSPELGHHRDASSDDADEDPSLEACGGDGPVVSCTTGSCEGEQEVPFVSHVCQETPESTAEKHREPQEMEQRKKIWSPCFMCPPFFGELSCRPPPEPPRRLEPLRTCTRPIRQKQTVLTSGERKESSTHATMLPSLHILQLMPLQHSDQPHSLHLGSLASLSPSTSCLAFSTISTPFCPLP
ncbi:hypothetical protein INR49_004404 [Caranx melampygus]|nr:hypothetical protein INR49_004404 [Caranx melampygus]